jgi:uncharacterized membrane protein
MLVFEKFVDYMNERKKLENFITDYRNLNFSLAPIKNKVRNNDFLTGDYYAKHQDYEVHICFYLNEDDDWVINVDGSNLSQSQYLKETFYYKSLNKLLESLKVNFLNLEENSELEIYIENKKHFLKHNN